MKPLLTLRPGQIRRYSDSYTGQTTKEAGFDFQQRHKLFFKIIQTTCEVYPAPYSIITGSGGG